MSHDLPALTGEELIKHLQKDGWNIKRRTKYGIALIKIFADRTRVTTVPTKGGSLPKKTLFDILGPKQTNIGRDGLLELLKRK